MQRVLVLLVLLGAAGGGAYVYLSRSTAPRTQFRTAEVTRGDLLVSISATGTAEPEDVINVGVQVLGKIEAFGDDPSHPGKVIDYGSTVEVGTVLAYIDDSLYSAEVAQAAAAVASAEASVQRARADLEQTKARMILADRNWKRAQELGPSRALSATDYDNYEATYETAKAAVAVSDAAVVQAEKGVQQAQATLDRVQTNLGYCTIRSPVRGVIIDRRVNIGQTVVASLNAPSLFLIAKDLRKMQVWAAVNEADIGNIYRGQRVTFTVDAFPGREFVGEVGKVRLNATMTQNVVTYVVEINTDNSDGQLLPYLTANVKFEVMHRENVLIVPNSALRWSPVEADIAPAFRESARGNGTRRGSGDGREGSGADGRQPVSTRPATGDQGVGNLDGEGRGPTATAPKARPALQPGRVWVRDNGYVRPIAVMTGPTDGSFTEIESRELREGAEIVIGIQARAGAAPESVTNPFTPQPFGNRQRQQ